MFFLMVRPSLNLSVEVKGVVRPPRKGLILGVVAVRKFGDTVVRSGQLKKTDQKSAGNF